MQDALYPYTRLCHIYGTEENLVAIESQHIHTYIPSPDNDHRTEFLLHPLHSLTEILILE